MNIQPTILLAAALASVFLVIVVVDTFWGKKSDSTSPEQPDSDERR